MRPRIMIQMLKMVGDPHEAENLVQEIWIRLSTAVHDSDTTIDNMQAFIRRSAANIGRDYLRSLKVRRKVLSKIPVEELPENRQPYTDSLDTSVDQFRRLQSLLTMLSHLPVRSREAFILIKGYGMRQSQVAKRLNVSISTIQKDMQLIKRLMIQDENSKKISQQVLLDSSNKCNRLPCVDLKRR